MPGKGKVYNSQSQQLILNVFNYFNLEKQNNGPVIPVSAVYDRVCTALQISSSSLCKIIQRSRQNPDGRPTTPPINQHKKGKGKVQTLDDLTKEAIRSFLHELMETKTPVSTDSLHNLLKEKELFSYSKSSMRVVVHDLGFYFKTVNKKTYVRIRNDIPSEIVWVKQETDDNIDSN